MKKQQWQNKSSNSEPYSFIDSPFEIQLIILSFLNIKDLLSFQLVNKYWNQLTYSFLNNEIFSDEQKNTLKGEWLDYPNSKFIFMSRPQNIRQGLLFLRSHSEKINLFCNGKIDLDVLYKAMLKDDILDIFKILKSRLSLVLTHYTESNKSTIDAHLKSIKIHFDNLTTGKLAFGRHELALVPIILKPLLFANAIKSHQICLDIYFSFFELYGPFKDFIIPKEYFCDEDRVFTILRKDVVLSYGFHINTQEPTNLIFVKHWIWSILKYFPDQTNNQNQKKVREQANFLENIIGICKLHNAIEVIYSVFNEAMDILGEEKCCQIIANLIKYNTKLYTILGDIPLRGKPKEIYFKYKLSLLYLHELTTQSNLLQDMINHLHYHISINKDKFYLLPDLKLLNEYLQNQAKTILNFTNLYFIKFNNISEISLDHKIEIPSSQKPVPDTKQDGIKDSFFKIIKPFLIFSSSSPAERPLVDMEFAKRWITQHHKIIESYSGQSIDFPQLYRAIADDHIDRIFKILKVRLSLIISYYTNNDTLKIPEQLKTVDAILKEQSFPMIMDHIAIITTILPALYFANAVNAHKVCLDIYFSCLNLFDVPVNYNRYKSILINKQKYTLLCKEAVLYYGFPYSTRKANSMIIIENLILSVLKYIPNDTNYLVDLLLKCNKNNSIAAVKSAFDLAFDILDEDVIINVLLHLKNTENKDIYALLKIITLRGRAKDIFPELQIIRSFPCDLEKKISLLQEIKKFIDFFVVTDGFDFDTSLDINSYLHHQMKEILDFTYSYSGQFARLENETISRNDDHRHTTKYSH